MKVPGIAESLNGGDVISFMSQGETEAGVGALSIHMNGAGAALPVIASLLCPGEVKCFTKGVQQRAAWINPHRVFFTVHGECHLYEAFGCTGIWRFRRSLSRWRMAHCSHRSRSNAGSAEVGHEIAA
jgi:hypothetical protein